MRGRVCASITSFGLDEYTGAVSHATANSQYEAAARDAADRICDWTNESGYGCTSPTST